MVIHLTPELEKALAERATALGTTPELLAIESLRKEFATADKIGATQDEATLYDALKDRIGVIDSSEFVPGGAQLSQNRAEKLMAILLQRHRKNQSQ